MAIYKISPAAEQDLTEFYIRSFHKWGEKLTDNYQLKLISAFRTLAENPVLGRFLTIRPQLQRHDVDPYIIFIENLVMGCELPEFYIKTGQ